MEKGAKLNPGVAADLVEFVNTAAASAITLKRCAAYPPNVHELVLTSALESFTAYTRGELHNAAGRDHLKHVIDCCMTAYFIDHWEEL